jgi:hypothetical protein
MLEPTMPPPTMTTSAVCMSFRSGATQHSSAGGRGAGAAGDQHTSMAISLALVDGRMRPFLRELPEGHVPAGRRHPGGRVTSFHLGNLLRLLQLLRLE